MYYNVGVVKDANEPKKSKENKMGAFTHYILKPLSMIGALNWGLVGFFKFDLVAWLFGPMTMFTRFVYAVIGTAALIWLFIWIFSDKPTCEYEHRNRD